MSQGALLLGAENVVLYSHNYVFYVPMWLHISEYLIKSKIQHPKFIIQRVCV